MVVDIRVLREQFKANISFFDKKPVKRLRYTNIDSGEYFSEGENSQLQIDDMQILAISENTDEFAKDSIGNILVVSYSCTAAYGLDIMASDFILMNGYDLYRIDGLNKIQHPITGEEIGKSFKLVFVETLDNEDLMR
jgi:hypothetical protein